MTMKRTLITLASATVLSISSLGSLAFADELQPTDASNIELARHGADDKVGDDRGNDGANHAFVLDSDDSSVARRGRGKDDKAGDDRGNDGPNHA
jgi:hypothetical protein